MLAMRVLGLAASLLLEASQAAEFQSLAALALASVKRAPQSFHAVAGAADILASAKTVQADLPVSQLLVSLLYKQGWYGCLGLKVAHLRCIIWSAIVHVQQVVSWKQKSEATLLHPPTAIQNRGKDRLWGPVLAICACTPSCLMICKPCAVTCRNCSSWWPPTWPKTPWP